MRSTIALSVAAVTASSLLGLTTPASANPAACAPRADIVQKLDETYKEARQAIALTKQGGLLEIFVSAKGSWSILVSSPNGKTCLVAAGENWQQQEQLVAHLGPQT
jgi:hypothetical protein